MPLTLSDAELAELDAYAMRNFRGDEVLMLKNWIAGKQQTQRMMEKMAKREAPPADPAPPPHSPLPNGAAAPDPAA